MGERAKVAGSSFTQAKKAKEEEGEGDMFIGYLIHFNHCHDRPLLLLLPLLVFLHWAECVEFAPVFPVRNLRLADSMHVSNAPYSLERD